MPIDVKFILYTLIVVVNLSRVKNQEKFVEDLANSTSQTGSEEIVDEDEVTSALYNGTINIENFNANDTIDAALPNEEDYIEAVNYGIKAMNDLFLVTEPKLKKLGLFLKSNDPAQLLATFNQQTDEAKELSKSAYANLQATKRIRNKFPAVTNPTTRIPLLKATIPIPDDSIAPQLDCPRFGIDPHCPKASLKYRTADGTCNNRRELWWGSAMSTMQRFVPAVYEDGIQAVRLSKSGQDLPSARFVSDRLHKERDSPLSSVTHMLMQWGQFIDHDITATGQGRAQCCAKGGLAFQPAEFMHPECMPIVVHANDSHLGRFNVRCLEFVRSSPAPREDCQFGAREQLDQVTSFIDASAIYGSNSRLSDNLRAFHDGLMRYGKDTPEDDESDVCKRGSLSTICFKPGDARVTEQPALHSLHVVFLRLHNKLADRLGRLNRHWNDERIYQEARKIAGAVVQHVTYREFLPIVLGPDITKIFDIELLRKGYYEGYDPSVNPNIANEFSSAAFRFGHSLVQRNFQRFDGHHRPILTRSTIHEDFSDPSDLRTDGSINKILLGLVNQPCQKRDEFISSELTQHLFQSPGFKFGVDLAAVNIQRGRDHGIAPFVQWRDPCRLSPIRDWDDLRRIVANNETVDKFREIYESVQDVDLFSAGLAEKPVVGGLVGPTIACIVAQQFRCLRKGDRFWYENSLADSSFSPEQLQQIRRVTLAQVLCDTVDGIESVQPFVMLTTDELRNQRLDCKDPMLNRMNLSSWLESDQGSGDVADDDDDDDDDTELRSRFGANSGNAVKKNQRPSAAKPLIKLPKPFKTRINQQNRINLQRPLGPRENLTIVISNHAVSSPIFVSDSIYNSRFKIKQSEKDKEPASTTARYNFVKTKRVAQHNFAGRPRPPPRYPPNYQDPSNPNPPVRGDNHLQHTKKQQQQQLSIGHNYSHQYSHRHDYRPELHTTFENYYPSKQQETYEYSDETEASEEPYLESDESQGEFYEPLGYAGENMQNAKKQQEHWFYKDGSTHYSKQINQNDNIDVTSERSLRRSTVDDIWSQLTSPQNELPKPIEVENQPE